MWHIAKNMNLLAALSVNCGYFTGKEVQVCETVQDGVRTAMDIADELEGMVCACGSLYICGDIRACFGLK